MAEYIEREAVLELGYWHGEHPDFDNPYSDGVDAVDAADIECIPAADVVPVVHGRWLKHYRSGVTVAEGCVSSCCDMWNERESHYCPHCGAKMDGGVDDAVD